jgi:hypothetical protein
MAFGMNQRVRSRGLASHTLGTMKTVRCSSNDDVIPTEQYRSPFEAATRRNDTYTFSPYRKENTTLHHYKDQLVDAV